MNKWIGYFYIVHTVHFHLITNLLTNKVRILLIKKCVMYWTYLALDRLQKQVLLKKAIKILFP
jgi:hypothetical protein